MTSELQRHNTFIQQAKQLLAKYSNLQTNVNIRGGREGHLGEWVNCKRIYEIKKGHEVILEHETKGVCYDGWQDKDQDETESLTYFRKDLGLEKKLEEE